MDTQEFQGANVQPEQEVVLLLRGIKVTRKPKDHDALEATPSDPNSDVEILRRALNIEPLPVTKLRENTNLQRTTIDRNTVSVSAQEDETVVRLGDKDWYNINGKLRTGTINGQPRKFIFSKSGVGFAGFDPFLDIYTINPPGLEKYQSDPEAFFSGLLHEAGHDSYMSLSEAKQRELNDLILKTPLLRDALFRFGTALYSDKLVVNGKEAGAYYLEDHSVSNEAARNIAISPSDNQKGVKDTRSLVFNLNGQPQEVFAGLLITEFMSHMSTLEMSRQLFDRNAVGERALRGGQDPRYDAIFLGFKRLQLDPQINQTINTFGIFKDNTPQFASDFAAIAGSAHS
jgi:hypothetical protein